MQLLNLVIFCYFYPLLQSHWIRAICQTHSSVSVIIFLYNRESINCFSPGSSLDEPFCKHRRSCDEEATTIHVSPLPDDVFHLPPRTSWPAELWQMLILYPELDGALSHLFQLVETNTLSLSGMAAARSDAARGRRLKASRLNSVTRCSSDCLTFAV